MSLTTRHEPRQTSRQHCLAGRSRDGGLTAKDSKGVAWNFATRRCNLGATGFFQNAAIHLPNIDHVVEKAVTVKAHLGLLVRRATDSPDRFRGISPKASDRHSPD